MADELSELDELIESDVLEALGEPVPENSTIEIDGITIEDVEALNKTDSNEVNEETPLEEPIEPINEEETPEASDENPLEEIKEESSQCSEESEEETEQNIQTVTSTDLASLLSELLNNKTIEITIKIKD